MSLHRPVVRFFGLRYILLSRLYVLLGLRVLLLGLRLLGLRLRVLLLGLRLLGLLGLRVLLLRLRVLLLGLRLRVLLLSVLLLSVLLLGLRVLLLGLLLLGLLLLSVLLLGLRRLDWRLRLLGGVLRCRQLLLPAGTNAHQFLFVDGWGLRGRRDRRGLWLVRGLLVLNWCGLGWCGLGLDLLLLVALGVVHVHHHQDYQHDCDARDDIPVRGKEAWGLCRGAKILAGSWRRGLPFPKRLGVASIDGKCWRRSCRYARNWGDGVWHS